MISNPRVFLADDSRASFDFFKKLIDSAGWSIVGYARDFESFINRAPQSEADVLLVSSGFLGIMSVRDRRALRTEKPERVVLAITDSDDYFELKAAVRTGARDCVRSSDGADVTTGLIYEYFAEAADARDLIAGRAVVDEEAPAVRETRGRVIAFCGADGGTGKSFLALQAAGMAALHAGAKTCLVDFDLSCGALSGIISNDAPGERTLGDLKDVIDEIRPVHVENLLREHTGGFSVICGPAPVIADVDGLFEHLVEPLRDMFDVIIVDFPPNPGKRFPAVLIDTAFIAMTPDAASACCARQMASIISNEHEGADIAGVINFCDRTGALKPAEIKRLSGLEIAAEVPEDEGAGLLFDRKGKVLAASTDLCLIRGLVPAVQKIKDFEEMAKPKRLSMFDEWRLPWAVNPDA